MHLRVSKKGYIVSYGMNKYDNKRGFGTTHAEIDAINHLPPQPNKKKLVKIDILVIRLTNHGKIGMSKPCLNCILQMQILPIKKGYSINNIYYSNEHGIIIKTNLNDILEEDLHISRFYRNSNFRYK